MRRSRLLNAIQWRDPAIFLRYRNTSTPDTSNSNNADAAPIHDVQLARAGTGAGNTAAGLLANSLAA